MPLRECQRRISSREYALWMAFYRLEAEANDPDREPDDDQMAAKMEAFRAVANARATR